MKTRELGLRSRGFTLLEVLVAVAVLALLYTTLAGVAIQGLRAEGESSRRLEASLLADSVLADVDVALEEGAPPPLGRQENESDDFTIVTEVSAYDFPVPLEAPEELKGGATLFGSRGRESMIRRVDVSVSWTEGVEELTVRRTSFGLDLEQAAPLLEGLASEQDAEQDGNPNPRDAGGDA
jgi:prepilin-type N-terminal cleavage/methylation domain-containing protein